jgi:hypothetical protein
MNNKNHYVYILENTNPTCDKKFYIGVRSCFCEPQNDNYFSSSKVIKNLIKNGVNFNKKILKTFKTREEAINYEIKLHKKYEVSNNIEFYNLVNQTNSKFDTSGYIFIDGDKISTIDYKNGNRKYHTKGKISLKDTYGNIIYVNVDDERRVNGDLKPLTKNLVPILDENLNKYILIPKNKYDKYNHKTSNKNKVAVIDSNGKTFLIDKNDKKYLYGEVKSVHTNKVLCKNNKGDIFYIDYDEYKKNNYVGINKGLVDKDKNPNAKKIIIYDSSDKIMYTTNGNFKDVCMLNNLPFNALKKSYNNNGQRIYNTKRGISEAKKLNKFEFIGWYAKIV